MKIRIGRSSDFGSDRPAGFNMETAEVLRLEAMGELVAAMMHEVNNILNPIMTGAYLLQQSSESPEMVRKHAALITAAVEGSAALSQSLSNFLLREPVNPSRVGVLDLSDLIATMSSEGRFPCTGPAGGGGTVELSLDLTPGACTVGIEGSIRTLILNLARNAADAMPQGGKLSLACEVGGGMVTVTVRDSGTGMAPETMARAFEPFFTTHRGSRKGLGLAEVYGIVCSHRAVMELDSVEGEGTTAVLNFPAVVGHGGTGLRSKRVDTAQGARRVLLVDDHAEGRALMRRILQADGHVVDDAASLKEARALLAVTPGSRVYDVMLTDLDLPDGSGIELVREARAIRPSMSIGVVSGWQPSMSDADLSGVGFVLHKPLRVDELRAHIWRVNIC